MASTRASRTRGSESPRPISRAIELTSRVCVSLVRTRGSLGRATTCVLPARRRKAREPRMRSLSRSKSGRRSFILNACTAHTRGKQPRVGHCLSGGAGLLVALFRALRVTGSRAATGPCVFRLHLGRRPGSFGLRLCFGFCFRWLVVRLGFAARAFLRAIAVGVPASPFEAEAGAAADLSLCRVRAALRALAHGIFHDSLLELPGVAALRANIIGGRQWLLGTRYSRKANSAENLTRPSHGRISAFAGYGRRASLSRLSPASA